jgi:DNA-binding IclR family transcriptional regulator
LDEVDVVYVDVIESTQRVKLAASTGEHLPAYCTASGKAILAFLSEGDVWRILDHGMPAHTQHTITSQIAFLENIRETKERGFAISEQEYEEGINAIAVPILSSAGEPVASISIAGPAYRLTRDRMDRIGSDLMAAAKKIAREVGLAENLG